MANVALPDPENKLKYFQGAEAPVYSAAYQVHLSGADRVPAFRQAQKKLEEANGELVKTETAFVTFGVRSVVFDQARGVGFDKSRRPRLPRLDWYESTGSTDLDCICKILVFSLGRSRRSWRLHRRGSVLQLGYRRTPDALQLRLVPTTVSC